MWENIDKSRKDSGDYSIMRADGMESGMDLLRDMFPEPIANELNFVLFSTSGVHGSYNLIEEAEDALNGKDKDGWAQVTFLIVHPRLVTLRYGTCNPVNQDDIDYLKKLRASSLEAVSRIGLKSSL